MAIAYFNAPGLPPTLSAIPLEYFAAAVNWLRSQPGVDPNRVWLYSGSYGAQAALLLAYPLPGLAHGVVAYAPSSYVIGTPADSTKPAWTLSGQPVPFAALDTTAATRNDQGLRVTRPVFQTALDHLPPDSPAIIPLDKINQPLLLISGGDDQRQPSAQFADRIIATLDADHDPSPHRSLIYPQAGHFVGGPPYLPGASSRNGGDSLGGTEQTNNAAHLDAWPITLDFIAHS